MFIDDATWQSMFGHFPPVRFTVFLFLFFFYNFLIGKCKKILYGFILTLAHKKVIISFLFEAVII